MKSHKLRLLPEYFEYIKNGTKRLEIRLNDEKRKNINIKDTIIFEKLDETKEHLTTTVTNLYKYNNFEELIDKNDITFLADQSVTKEKLLKRSSVDSYNWWLYPYPKNLLVMDKPKIIYQVLSQKGSFTLDENGEFYYVGGGTAGGYSITTKSEDINELKYLLGILNSKLTLFFISKVASSFKGGYYSFGKQSFEHFSLPTEKLFDSLIIDLVDIMINLNNQLQNVKTPQEEKLLKIQIDNIDKQINNRVYELYGLSEEEITIIENSFEG